MNYPNLCTAYEAGLRLTDTPRGDELAPHASDLGKCYLQTWARRNGQPMLKRSAKTSARLQGGLRDEEWIFRLLQAPLEVDGWTIERSTTLDEGSDLTGHLDLVLCKTFGDQDFRCVVDIKTTEWREVWEDTGEVYPDTQKPVKTKTYIPYDDAPGRAAILQVLTYARSMVNPDGKHAPFAILQACRRSFLFTQFPAPGAYYDPDEPDLVREWEDEKAAILEKTAPGVDPVKAGIATRNIVGDLMGEPPMDTYNNKGITWACKYCDFYGCARNANPDAEVIS